MDQRLPDATLMRLLESFRTMISAENTGRMLFSSPAEACRTFLECLENLLVVVALLKALQKYMDGCVGRGKIASMTRTSAAPAARCNAFELLPAQQPW